MKIWMRADDLKRVMNTVAKNVAGKNDPRQLLRHISMRLYNTGMAEFASMDGNRTTLMVAYAQYDLIEYAKRGEPDPVEVLIDPVSVPKGSNLVEIQIDDTTTTFSFGGGSTICQTRERGEYMPYDRTMPTDPPDFIVWVNPRVL